MELIRLAIYQCILYICQEAALATQCTMRGPWTRRALHGGALPSAPLAAGSPPGEPVGVGSREHFCRKLWGLHLAAQLLLLGSYAGKGQVGVQGVRSPRSPATTLSPQALLPISAQVLPGAGHQGSLCLEAVGVAGVAEWAAAQSVTAAGGSTFSICEGLSDRFSGFPTASFHCFAPASWSIAGRQNASRDRPRARRRCSPRMTVCAHLVGASFIGATTRQAQGGYRLDWSRRYRLN